MRERVAGRKPEGGQVLGLGYGNFGNHSNLYLKKRVNAEIHTPLAIETM